MVREPGWPVTLLGVPPNATVTDRLLSGARAKVTGSDQTAWPWAMVTDALPENASALSVAVSMVLLTGIALHRGDVGGEEEGVRRMAGASAHASEI